MAKFIEITAVFKLDEPDETGEEFRYDRTWCLNQIGGMGPVYWDIVNEWERDN